WHIAKFQSRGDGGAYGRQGASRCQRLYLARHRVKSMVLTSHPFTPSRCRDRTTHHERPLTARDLPTADRIIRLAFGTFVGAPEPEQFCSDLDYARTRWLADPTAAFGAELDAELVGSNFATRWGSVGFFGPLTVCPDLWDRGIGTRPLDPIMEC